MKTGLKPQMRPSKVSAKLRAGEMVNCYKLNMDSARAAEIAALAGFDYDCALKAQSWKEQSKVMGQLRGGTTL